MLHQTTDRYDNFGVLASSPRFPRECAFHFPQIGLLSGAAAPGVRGEGGAACAAAPCCLATEALGDGARGGAGGRGGIAPTAELRGGLLPAVETWCRGEL